MNVNAAKPSTAESANSKSISFCVEAKVDPGKLISLLALAAAAATVPQSGNADVILTDLSANPVTVGLNTNISFIINNFPGTAQIGFQAVPKPMAGATMTKWISVRQNGGYVRLKTHSSFIIPVGPGLTWNQVVGVGVVSSNFGLAATATVNNNPRHFPESFDHKYFVFKFKDNTQVGSPLRYGWIDVSLSNPVTGGGPDLTIFGYAYDNTGATLATGQVPEPTSATLLALGALTLGAKGLRSWRRNRR